MALSFLILLIAAAAAEERGGAFVPIAERLRDIEFECAWRAVAYDYGRALLPKQGAFVSLFDALQLGTLCNKTAEESAAQYNSSYDSKKTDASSSEIYVDYAAGSDR